MLPFFFFFFLRYNVQFFVFLFIYFFIYLFLAVLGLRFCVRAFSSCGEGGPLFIAVRGPELGEIGRASCRERVSSPV